MTKTEVLTLLSQKGLLKVKSENRCIEYIDGSLVYYDKAFHNKRNVFGVFFDEEYGYFEFFVTDNERNGMIEYYDDFDNEDDAFTAMFKYIERENRIYGARP